MGLGDLVERALAIVGVTPAKVSRILGSPCDCEDRKQKLNALGAWAHRVMTGRVLGAREYLNRILGADPNDGSTSG